MSQQCETQADCFRELARVAKMCEGTTVKYKDCIKFAGIRSSMPAYDIEQRRCPPEKVSAAIAIVEDKPVFIGDTIYMPAGDAWVATIDGFRCGDMHMSFTYHHVPFLSWNPPKPKALEKVA